VEKGSHELCVCTLEAISEGDEEKESQGNEAKVFMRLIYWA